MNKEMEFAGSFYPADVSDLKALFETYKDTWNEDYKSKAIIVPHAGYKYSGHCAMSAYQHLEINENVFIIAPSHHMDFKNIALPKYTYFETPFGNIEVNNRLIKQIADKFPCYVDDEPFSNEHSIEAQLPLLYYTYYPPVVKASDIVKNIRKIGQKLRIIPILVGRCDYRLISDLISEYYENSSFIISSDLSHFFPINECRQIDSYTAMIIETGKLECFQQGQACGLIGIEGLLNFANKTGQTLIRSEMYNSGDVTGETEKVVGYGSWFMYQGTKNDYIEKYCKDFILKTAKESIESAFSETEYIPENIPPVLTQLGASFITLNTNGHLRGCIGSVYPVRPLVSDIIENARHAAFHDSRFISLQPEEMENLEISISVLSSIERIKYKDEKDLLSKIYPYGVIISEGDFRAVYLPVVWEQLPDREIFFNSLKEKAGLPPTYFSKTMEVYKFTTLYIKKEPENVN